ncbi:Slp family lipoprotein [Pantoea sp. Nvir]|nr:Slp family lipoprotein [Pantoea sp. Nvir]
MFLFHKEILRVSLICMLLLSGCSTVPDSIKGSSVPLQQDLVRVMNNPALYVGQQSRFGGKVMKVMNLKDKTRIEIATQPLDNGARPRIKNNSVGRIYADINKFVDPVDLDGHYVTVLGTIKGTEKNTIGQSLYNFLVVDIKSYKRWHTTQRVIMPVQSMNPWMFYNHPYNESGSRSNYWIFDPYWTMSKECDQVVDTILTK